MANPSTKFAPSARAEWEELAEQIRCARENGPLRQRVCRRRNSNLVLNRDRQVIFANQAFQAAFGIEDLATVYGCRLGEILDCQHAGKGEGGCGTSRDCRLCHAVHAMLHSLRDSPDIQRCSIQTKNRSEPLHCLIFTMPVKIASFSCILVELADPAVENSPDFGNQILELQRLVAEIETA